MASLTWEQRGRPVLEAIVQLEEGGTHRDASIEFIAELTGLESAVVSRTLQSLIEARFVDAMDSSAFRSSYAARRSEKTYRSTHAIARQSSA